MKRILLTILAIMLCLSIFSGCDKECGHNWERISNYNESTAQDKCTKCGETRLYTDPDSIPEKHLPIVLTIAETLPSCVAFQYREPYKPYCLYAYDADGHLYRVLWTDWDGLSEKDRIVVEYSDMKEIDQTTNPSSGWNPKYEITATSVTLEKGKK